MRVLKQANRLVFFVFLKHITSSNSNAGKLVLHHNF